MMHDRLLEQLVRRPLDHPGASARADVPCGSCRRCCRGNSIVMLLPDEGDVVASYEHEIINLPGAGRGPVLKRKPNGDCTYLGENGCTIHDRAPTICRVFDCRGAYRAFMQHTRNERRRILKGGMIDKEILDAGRDRLIGEEAA
jgi:Fe-S-cluster containining protein